MTGLTYHRSGYKVIAVCSGQNFEYVRGLGAHEVFDHRAPDCGKHIRKYCKDGLKFAWDTIAVTSSAQICADALSSSGGHYCSLLPVEMSRTDVWASFMDASTVFGEYYE
jgi:NADPH:quinone reductase-like Zn-dependent oxidoreductase